MQPFFLPTVLLVGLTLGALLAHILWRGRVTSQIEAAVAKADSAARGELAQLRERARLGEENKTAAQEVYDTLTRQADCWRNELDAARDERSQLTERALRVPALESEVSHLTDKVGQVNADLLRVSSSEAQKGQAAALLQQQVNRLEGAMVDLTQRFSTSSDALNESNERKAGLEAQALRLPELELRLVTAETEADAASLNMSALRESSSGEISGLKAELHAEREALRLARLALPTARIDFDERVRLADKSKTAAQGDYDSLKDKADSWRNELDAAREQLSQLTERALRVPVLEQEVDKMAGELSLVNVELLRISSSEAQKGQAASSLAQQVTRLEETVAGLNQKLTVSHAALNASNESNAGLGEQALRLPGLEAKLLATETLADAANGNLSTLRESSSSEISRLAAELKAASEALVLTRGALDTARLNFEGVAGDLNRVTGEVTELRTRMEGEKEAAQEKLALLMEAKTTLSDQFKSLATEILEEKSKRFAEQNQATIGQLLEPLKAQLSEFKGKVEEVYVQEGKDRSALSEQVKQLLELNHTLSSDAKNLTSALKGSAKTQGTWGELILERVLELSGLRRGHEYHVQESQIREDGSRAQADVVINLPEERRLVVDAKVSLVAYESHIAAETDEARALAIRRHLESVKAHIKGLSSKQYQTLYGLKSLDFVLMFIPIEPAFMMAVTHDNALFMEAWDKNVLLVSPSTLLFVVRTVAHLWRQEQQTKNSQDIAKRGAELYDRLVGFVEDLQTVGTHLGRAQTAFELAQKKLAVGKGNVIRQAEMLKELGVKPSKALPSSLVDMSITDDALILVRDDSTLNPAILSKI